MAERLVTPTEWNTTVVAEEAMCPQGKHVPARSRVLIAGCATVRLRGDYPFLGILTEWRRTQTNEIAYNGAAGTLRLEEGGARPAGGVALRGAAAARRGARMCKELCAGAPRGGAGHGVPLLQREPHQLRRPRGRSAPGRDAFEARIPFVAGKHLGRRSRVHRRNQPHAPGTPEQALPDHLRQARPGASAHAPRLPLGGDESAADGRGSRTSCPCRIGTT